MSSQPKRSWGHRIYKRKNPDQCSVAGCHLSGDFSLSFYHSKGQRRRLIYCIEHAQGYAKSVGLSVPGELDYLNVVKFSSSDLRSLCSRIEDELALRSAERVQTDDRLRFYFEGEGDAKGEGSPYAAALYERNGAIKRFFFTFRSEELRDNQIRKSGRYTTRINAIVEKRFRAGTELQRNFYLVTSEGSEVHVGEYADEERRLKVYAFIRGEVPLEDLVEKM